MREFRVRAAAAAYARATAAARSAREHRGALRIAAAAVLVGTVLLAVPIGQARATVDPCGTGGNPVACENSKTGTPQTSWDVSASQGTTIAGFADPFSVNLGGTINFKIQSAATSYKIDIYRMGYYGGDGARFIQALTPNITASQNQPSCATNKATGLVDCSNWAISASWTVPTTLVSGVYFAHIYRTDTSTDANQIPFVVRNDASHSSILLGTNDETWQAYNDWGGYSLYTGNATDTLNRPTSLDPGRAEQVSYDRPFATRFDTPGGQDYFFYAEFPTIEFLEENGYDVSYIDQGTAGGSNGTALLEQHKAYVRAGHDEYWTAGEVSNVTAARNAGVNLAFFTGNELFWKTRWGTDAAGEAGRTLITYKESLDSAVTDPLGPSIWTGEFADRRYNPPGDAQPQNALTGQLWTVNAGTSAITVPAQYAALRLWRNTSIAALQPGQTATLTAETLGYEWDQDVDNGLRPGGEFDLSSTTVNAPQVITDYQEDLAAETVTHHLTEYRAASGALVFEAGTVQWAWGLNSNHDGDAQPAVSQAMQQATVNLLADMGNVQPVTLMSGLTAAAQSTDTTPPASTITSPAAGASIANGSSVTVTGTATDSGGGVVAGVEVSTDGGANWHPATTMTAAGSSVTWSYTWAATGNGSVTIESRATDDSGNIETPGSGVTVTVNCPCSLYPQAYVPAVTSANDSTPQELGVKFTSSQNGWVTGVRFYKGTGNNGTHTGSLWTADGTQLATGTFTNETASGWQTLTFSSPVKITASTVYVASYYTPDGHYAFDAQQFYPGLTGSPDLAPLDSTPLAAVHAGYTATNGMYNPGGPGFPMQSYNSSGYGVDVVFASTIPPSVSSASPASGATGVAVTSPVTATFDEPIKSGTATITVTDPSSTQVSGTTSLDSTGTILTFTPASSLAAGTAYTVTVSGAVSQAGTAMTAPQTWQFTTEGSCPCTIWPSSATPTVASANDTNSGDLGVKFTASANGYITGIRFYKGSANTGTHVGSLWDSSGNLLGRVTFTSETASGWQEADFASPVAVTAGTTYVATYFAPNGGYSYTPAGLTSAVTSGPLTALSSSVSGGNGVYDYSGSPAFPTSTYNANNYWVDVVFTTTATTPPPASCPCTIWSSSATPTVASADDPGAGDLGVKFTPSASGHITGIRFYKGSANTGTHVGSLWDSSGNLLGRVTFTSETASGWQEADFSSPIAVTAGTTYVATYFAPNGGYSYTPAGLSSGVTSGPLTAPSSSSSGGNGVYDYSSSPAFPTSTYNANNYWVDVVFTTS